MLNALRLWNIIKMMCIKPRLVIVSKSEVIIAFLAVVIVVVIVVIVAVLIIVIIVIIIILEITPPYARNTSDHEDGCFVLVVVVI